MDDWFNEHTILKIQSNSLVDRVLKEIDGASIISGTSVETKFGITDMTNLSSGCKALLVAMHEPDMIVNFIMAGRNAVRLALGISQFIDMRIYTPNSVSLYREDLQIDVNLDGEIVKAEEWMYSTRSWRRRRKK